MMALSEKLPSGLKRRGRITFGPANTSFYTWNFQHCAAAAAAAVSRSNFSDTRLFGVVDARQHFAALWSRSTMCLTKQIMTPLTEAGSCMHICY
jgi:hypothetical protein